MNNAVTRVGAGFWDPLFDWRHTVDVNLWGVIHGVRAFVPEMIASGNPGCLINMGSKQGITNPPGNTVYNLTKAALKSYTESLQHELRNGDNPALTAHLVIPGWTTTGKREHKPGAWLPEQIVDEMLPRIEAGDFYIVCPDGEVTREMDRTRILWSAGDVAENRPALSRWHGDYDDAFKAFDSGLSRCGIEDDFRGPCAAGQQIIECLNAVLEFARFDPVERAKRARRHGRQRRAEVGHGIGIGTDKSDFLQRHTSGVEAVYAITEPDMHDNRSRSRRADGCSPGVFVADRVNHHVGETRVQCPVRRRIDNPNETLRRRCPASEFIGFRNRDVAASKSAERQRRAEPDRPRSHHHGARFRQWPCGVSVGERNPMP